MKSLITPNRSWWASIKIGYWHVLCIPWYIPVSFYRCLIFVRFSNKTHTLLVTGDGMAGFPCWEPLEKQFSVATELGPDHIGNAADGKVETWSQMMLLQVTSPLLTPPTSFTTTAWTTWPGTGPGWCSSPPWAAQTTSTLAGCRATPGTGPSSSPSTPTTSAWSSSGTWCGRQTPGPSSASQPSSSRWV